MGKLPYPSVNFGKQIKTIMQDKGLALQSLAYEVSGELTSTSTDVPLGCAHTEGQIADFVISVAGCGRDDTNALALTATLKKNGVSVHETSGEAIITGVSGEASSAQVSEVCSFGSVTVARGDRFTMDLTLTRTASPTTEMNGIFAALKIVPVV